MIERRADFGTNKRQDAANQTEDNDQRYQSVVAGGKGRKI